MGETFVFPDQTLYSGDEGSEHNAQLIINRAMLTYEHDELEWDPEAYQDGYNWENQDAWMLYGLDSTGPAEPGSIWLILDMRIEIQGPDGVLDFDGGTWTLTAVDQDGSSTQHEYTSEASGIDQWPYGDYGAAFEVPISAATVDLVASLEVEYEGQSSTIESATPITLDLLPEN
ncbi:hypothetical protein [Nesterenkonia pannonica]|uniref:hypothetical protein n=1 Tax=Nesterenkonia pannonica TaxID=1548602 RepID=UPI002164658E|nr:hypothetical protein [Nesterenkonia pannonica]